MESYLNLENQAICAKCSKNFYLERKNFLRSSWVFFFEWIYESLKFLPFQDGFNNLCYRILRFKKLIQNLLFLIFVKY